MSCSDCYQLTGGDALDAGIIEGSFIFIHHPQCNDRKLVENVQRFSLRVNLTWSNLWKGVF